ncbi:hypothetical protein [Streptomyces bohaiensis]|uniref:hypothetical protein n=1 Tax=Streptomyces bohaiensis TaxID=1431344 RepID=UPI003B7D24F0
MHRIMYTLQSLANGLRTDHPVPGLPFVDDAHLPLDDPEALEAIGRGAGDGMWGRWDSEQPGRGWRGYTTDPIRHDLAWVVRHHPALGRSVLLIRDEDAASMHSALQGAPLLYRAGGYWWDGATWYRPAQIWDSASENYLRTPAKSAITVSAADLLDDTAEPTAGQIRKIATFDSAADAPTPHRWTDHLALWAEHRTTRSDAPTALQLTQCVVKPSAPELAGDQLVGIPEMAELAGIAASTLRAYVSRGEGDVPLPQATVSGRSAWSRPVAQDWAHARRRSADSVVATLTGGDASTRPPGIRDVQDHFGRAFHASLFSRPDIRKRWALRWRGEDEVRKVADQLARNVADGLDQIIPTDDLAATVRHAVLDELALQHDGRPDQSYGLSPRVTRTLDWLIRHHPKYGHRVLGDIVGEAERRVGIPRHRMERCLRTSLALDGKLSDEQLHDYLEVALPPTKATTQDH